MAHTHIQILTSGAKPHSGFWIRDLDSDQSQRWHIHIYRFSSSRHAAAVAEQATAIATAVPSSAVRPHPPKHKQRCKPNPRRGQANTAHANKSQSAPSAVAMHRPQHLACSALATVQARRQQRHTTMSQPGGAAPLRLRSVEARAPRRRCANGSLCTPFRGHQAGKTAGAKQATTVPSSAARGPLWPAARSARIQNPESRIQSADRSLSQSLETAGVIITCMPGGLELQSALRILDLDSGFSPSESRIQNPEYRL